MITLTLSVDSIATVIQVYNRIQIARADSETGIFTTVSGLGPVVLVAGVSTYELIDTTGTPTNWYQSRYYSTITSNASAWSDPVLGEAGNIFYNPLYPPEVSYGTSEQLVINRIRLLIGDPKGIRRFYGDEAISSIYEDGKTLELSEKGWPASVNMAGKNYSDSSNPSVNGYKYLIFQEYIDDICTSCSGVVNNCGDEVIKDVVEGADIWYYTFRESDREIMDAYDTCPPPIGLTINNATSQAYILKTAIELITKELIEDANEDGAEIRDEGSSYDPSSGQKIREALLGPLRKQLDDLIKMLQMQSITGVLVD